MILGFLNKAWDLLGGTYSIYETDKSGKTKIIMRFNTIEEAFFRSTSQVTSYPTETGVMVTDYKYDDPDVLTVKGILKRSTLVGALVNSLLGGVDSIPQLMTTLNYYKSGMYSLNIQTKAALREGYTLQDYEIPEDYDNYGLLEVSMTFKQILNVGKKNLTKPSDSDTIPAGFARLVGLS
ncbi:MAG: hypothetical protein J1F17_04190 [Oscillospiraceae bacterium]|nr:hypothetical protein [Oscillospiraceae bacterium]